MRYKKYTDALTRKTELNWCIDAKTIWAPFIKVNIPRMTIKRRYENKGIDLIKLINSSSYYQKVKKNVNSRGSLEFKDK